jgi:hypothetical protein
VLENLKALLPQIEEFASICDAEFRAAEQRAKEADRELSNARAKSIAADQLLRIAREAVEGTFTEVPL